MSQQDRWCKSANEIVIDAWRYSRRLGRTSAERIALFNVEMEGLERQGARALRAHAKRRRTSSQAQWRTRRREGRRRPS